ncbi:universal stress protein in QAH/OAS sulfhydrylase 3'region-like [Ruditapes philippinarum]|uniref:universal stress protein in QAH/OAS sulfhydrylase 3'region-like n=1 Tax=Ruditapes philippinarum TaxID=129788 RepID=UPI00295BE202|nr:universal stress protein in QAH/OAS sulfhydrylase 3'region-like [Ruditapes philippinarum]
MSNSRTIVIAIDDSEQSLNAFNFYVDNVNKVGDRVILVHVPEYSNVITDSSLLTDTQILAELMKVTEEKTRKLEADYILKMNELRINGSMKQHYGTPSEAIIAVVNEEKADLLILGSKGRGFIRRTFLGSVSDYCLHHCNVPVIICPHKAQKHSRADFKPDKNIN